MRHPDDRDKILKGAALILLVLSFILPHFRQVLDIDFWWHLATGREIFERGTLLKEDPFTYTAGLFASTERIGILNRYWLGQVLFYLFYLLGGVHGIIILRVLIFALILLSIGFFRGTRNLSMNILLIFLSGHLMKDFTGLRPQVFTFLCFVLTILIIEKAGYHSRRDKENFDGRYLSLLPPLMLLWANLHPGYILGVAVLGLYVIGEIGQILLGKEKALRKEAFKLAGIGMLSFILTLINPVFYKSYLSLIAFEGSFLQSRTSEYISPINYLLKGGPYLTAYWVFLFIFLVFLLLSVRKIGLTRFLISLFLLLISLMAFRYVPYFMFGGMIILKGFVAREVSFSDVKKRLQNLVGSIIMVLMVIINLSYIDDVVRTWKSPVNDARFPVDAVDYIKSMSLPPRIFNHFNWGGYLEWNLYPRYRFFIDSRTLSKRAFRDYTYMLWDSKMWKPLMNSYGINTVLMPPNSPSRPLPSHRPRMATCLQG
jgi:hypothetical protein